MHENRQAVFSDTIGNLTLVNLKDGNVARNFKSIAGAVTSIQALSSRPWIVCGGLDRFLRIFDVGKGSLVKGLYLKQRLSQVLVLEEEETNENDDGDADQDVWSSLAKVGEEQERRSSKKLKQM